MCKPHSCAFAKYAIKERQELFNLLNIKTTTKAL